MAKFLYPEANITNGDIRTYKPNIRFDYVIGNPPYDLSWWVEDEGRMQSQLYFCLKAAECLKPKGIMAVIMVLAKEKLNMYMKGKDADLDEIYSRFGVDYDLMSLLMYREQDSEGKFHIRWGEQKIA